MSLGQRVKQLRKGLDLTQQQLADRLGVDRSYVGHIERGRTGWPGEDVIRALARALHVDSSVLLQEAIEPSPPESPSIEDQLRAISTTANSLMRQFRSRGTVTFTGDPTFQVHRAHAYRVPRMSQLPSAGPGTVADAEYVEFQSWEIKTPANLIAVTITGSCLEPDVMHGSTLIVDTSRTANLPGGTLVVAIHEGELLAKYLVLRDGAYWLASNTHPDIRPNGDTRVIGEVVHTPPPRKR